MSYNFKWCKYQSVVPVSYIMIQGSRVLRRNKIRSIIKSKWQTHETHLLHFDLTCISFFMFSHIQSRTMNVSLLVAVSTLATGRIAVTMLVFKHASYVSLQFEKTVAILTIGLRKYPSPLYCCCYCCLKNSNCISAVARTTLEAHD